MLLFIAFLLFAALFAAWLAAPSTDSAERPAAISPDVALPEPRTSAV